ncbi:hypothetical protein DPMN_146387 [Dreissena polymorpha]|uniref:Uncharacterized protein n=1 Tax=Dreissena polymorpha TaxID=45954 RepID=A0A9D4F7T5_DREPO|nr:hypothetical protein DPMN_146387 [Dreissena polymorpha]
MFVEETNIRHNAIDYNTNQKRWRLCGPPTHRKHVICRTRRGHDGFDPWWAGRRPMRDDMTNMTSFLLPDDDIIRQTGLRPCLQLVIQSRLRRDGFIILPSDVRDGTQLLTKFACASRPRRESPAEDLLTCTYFLIEGTSAGGSANPAESATLEPDVFYTTMFAFSPKMQRSSQPLLIDGVWLSHYTFQERDWRERDSELPSVEDKHRGFERSIKYVDQLYDFRIKDFYSFDDICYIYGIPSNNFLKIDPCGTPQEIPATSTSCCLSERYDLNHLNISSPRPAALSFIRRWTRGGGTQCAQRSGETVSGLKTTAGDNESGHTGRAACCTPSAELRPDKN